MSAHLARLPRNSESDAANRGSTLMLGQESIQKWWLNASVIYEVEKGVWDAKGESRTFRFLLHVHKVQDKAGHQLHAYVWSAAYPNRRCRWYWRGKQRLQTQSLAAQTQLTHGSEHKNQSGFWGIAVRFGGFSVIEGGGEKNSFFTQL